jgi:hypothetical protein
MVTAIGAMPGRIRILDAARVGWSLAAFEFFGEASRLASAQNGRKKSMPSLNRLLGVANAQRRMSRAS